MSGVAIDSPRVAIVGAGIIGVAMAFQLSRSGYRVSLFDRSEPGQAGPSRGNAGHVAGSDIFPLSGPGIVLSGLKMLANRDGALKIGMRYLPKLAPWLWQFRQAGTGRAYQSATAAITQLCRGSVTLTEQMFNNAGIGHMFRRVAALYVYEKEETLEASMAGWALKQQAGHTFTRLTREQIAEQEPALAKTYIGGVLSHDWAVVSDPLEVVQGLFGAALRQGVVFHKTEIASFEFHADGIFLAGTQASGPFDRVIIAAGLGSKKFATQLGERLPIEGEGGYNLTYPQPGVAVNYPMVFADRGVTSTTLSTGLRIGGWAEFAGPDAPARTDYFKRLQAISKDLIPGLDTSDGRCWMGRRPSTPDSVPVLSRSSRDPRIIYATGHGHYGLSWAARTSKLVESLLRSDQVDMPAFSISRFN